MSLECWGRARQAVPVRHGVDEILDLLNLDRAPSLLSLEGSIGRDKMAGLTLRSFQSLLIILTRRRGTLQ